MISGKVLACKWIKLACQRHLDDKEAAKAADFPYLFDPAKAEKVAKFLQLLPHTKGKWASKRERIKLEPWQLFSVCIPFGWVRKSDGQRQADIPEADDGHRVCALMERRNGRQRNRHRQSLIRKRKAQYSEKK